ncbi:MULTISPECIES: lipid-A-disaccharide synthase-related protein [Aphanothece]|uniref:lipid-A-disaccharide synthase-related protein n=1 Tax=Aphanothece TaxID=1121 RepID=UPI0039855B9A
MASVLLLSNGHGEDLSGALIGAGLMARGIAVEALPLVGHGQAYRQRGIPILGRTRECSTGGLGFTSFRGQLSELLEGQVAHVLGSLLWLIRHRRRHRLVIAVGDLVAVLGAWLGGRRSAVYLVAYSSHYEGRLRLPWPCGWMLRRPSVLAVWSRDALTAHDLSQQLRRPVTFLGNPFLDAALGPPRPASSGQVLALLPGSRLPEAAQNLELMLQLLALLPAAGPLRAGWRVQAALVPALDAAALGPMAERQGWHWAGNDRLRRDGLDVELVWSGFNAVLANADLVVAMAGTATEQAVGLGRPVLQLVGDGPQFTEGFAEAQRRLLGPGVFCAPGGADRQTTLRRSATLAHDLLAQLADPRKGTDLRDQLAATAAERIGPPGGSERLTAAIMDLLTGTHG